ncbi:hypothetical protein HCN44_004531 [Aphidius gifuensis]|uniref:Uncharacterized protein n=1 Tax=Aphidius gifuensis TaxID=684658 RepID=A0A835CTH2_APHGI|nr:uncharacterized protein LOC122848850 [Aphidius gifuensis]XP_044003172.1 uncharacterized protein LOC122848850 [Aphidius gifuensis]KAF7995059.1 hypothetical protein HCN44_004531 [Aphidius gifuensis]
MSAILRNTLRFVSTAKYATNNSTKNLRSMTFTTSVNNSLPLLQPNYLNRNEFEKLQFIQAKKISTNFGTTMWTAGKKMLSLISNEEIKKATIGQLKVSLGSGKIRLLTEKNTKNLIFPPTFNIELNEKLIEPKSNKITNEEEKTLAFKLDQWHVSLDDDELTFKMKDTGEEFILKHAVHVVAHMYPPKPLEDGSYRSNSGTPISDVKVYPAKEISKSDGSEPLDREFPPISTVITPKQFDTNENDKNDEYNPLLPKESNQEITDRPNSDGRMKLKFPMTASLEGSRQKILLKDCDDTYTVYHTVDIQASNKLAKIANKKKDGTSKIGKLQMVLYSGELIFEPRASSLQCVSIKHDVDIEIDLESEIPSILISPHMKMRRRI